MAHPDLVAETVRAGHEVANHSQDHLWLDEQPRWVVADQIESARRSIASVGGGPTQMFRPPRGWTSPDVAAATEAAGLGIIFWSDCLEAHLASGAATAATEVAQAASPGAIILCHDGGRVSGPNSQDIDRSGTVAALPRLLDTLVARGLQPVLLSRLLSLATT